MGGLRSWGPPRSVQTSSGCEHNSQGWAFEKQRDTAQPPWGTSKVCLALHHQKARVFDGCLLTWPQHHISPRARGFGSWEAERKRVAVRRGHTWELGHSSEGLFFQIMGFSQVPQSCFVLALSDLHLECSTQPFSFLLQCTSRQAFQVILAKSAILQALESAIATAGDCWGFCFQTWWFES